MWDIWQETRLNDVSRRQRENVFRTKDVDAQVLELNRQVQKMALVNQALFELLKEKVGISDEELRRKVREVDLRDGVQDGDLKAKPLKCPKCGSTVTAGALSCMGCGATVAPQYPFEI